MANITFMNITGIMRCHMVTVMGTITIITTHMTSCPQAQRT